MDAAPAAARNVDAIGALFAFQVGFARQIVFYRNWQSANFRVSFEPPNSPARAVVSPGDVVESEVIESMSLQLTVRPTISSTIGPSCTKPYQQLRADGVAVRSRASGDRIPLILALLTAQFILHSSCFPVCHGQRLGLYWIQLNPKVNKGAE